MSRLVVFVPLRHSKLGAFIPRLTRAPPISHSEMKSLLAVRRGAAALTGAHLRASAPRRILGDLHPKAARCVAAPMRCASSFSLSQSLTPPLSSRPPGTPFIVGVAGGTASGKTAVVTRIVEQLGVISCDAVAVLPQDCFYRDLDAAEKAEASATNFNFDHPAAFDFDAIAAALRRVREGHPTIQVTARRDLAVATDVRVKKTCF